MPCRDDDYFYQAQQNKRHTEIVQLLCESVTLLRAHNILLSPKLQRWAIEHDKVDAARIKAENEAKARSDLKKSAAKKLSKAEREVLGL